MMGASPYVTRAELVRQRATGVDREIDDATQAGSTAAMKWNPRCAARVRRTHPRRRPLSHHRDWRRRIPGASFDGVTLSEEFFIEAKQAERREDGAGAGRLHACGRPLAGGAPVRGLQVGPFVPLPVGDGSEEGTVHLLVTRGEIARDIPKLLAGWAQFDDDVAAYQPEPSQRRRRRARHPTSCRRCASTSRAWSPSRTWPIQGRRHARAGRDQSRPADRRDFADAEQTVKWAKGVEERLEAVKGQALSQTADIEAVFRTIDEVSAETRRIRLELEKAGEGSEGSRAREIVAAGVAAVRATTTRSTPPWARTGSPGRP